MNNVPFPIMDTMVHKSPKKNLLSCIHLTLLLCTLLPGLAHGGDDPKNSIGLQPLGFLFAWSNLEYERLLTTDPMPISVLGRINFSTQTIGKPLISPFKDEKRYPDMWTGFGLGLRAYYDGRKMRSYFIGVGYDHLGGNYIPEYSYTNQAKSGELSWLSAEMGRKIVLGKSGQGVSITPTAGMMFILNNTGETYFKSFSYSIGCTLGYEF